MDESVYRQALETGDISLINQAIASLDSQIHSSPSWGEKANLQLGKVTLFGIASRFEEARRALDEVMRYGSDDPDIRLQHDFMEAILYDQERKPDDAYKALTSLLSRYSERLSRPDVRFMYEDLQLRRGIDATALGKYQEARLLLLECLEFKLADGDRELALFGLGRCYFEEEKFESAREYLEAASRTHMSKGYQSECHFYLGITYARLGLLTEARAELRICAEIPSESELDMRKLYAWLAWVAKALGNAEEATLYSGLAKPV